MRLFLRIIPVSVALATALLAAGCGAAAGGSGGDPTMRDTLLDTAEPRTFEFIEFASRFPVLSEDEARHEIELDFAAERSDRSAGLISRLLVTTAPPPKSSKLATTEDVLNLEADQLIDRLDVKQGYSDAVYEEEKSGSETIGGRKFLVAEFSLVQNRAPFPEVGLTMTNWYHLDEQGRLVIVRLVLEAGASLNDILPAQARAVRETVASIRLKAQ